MQHFAKSLTQYKRLDTKEVNVGGLYIGSEHPIRLQTMTTTDTMDTIATVEQTIKCIEAGAELVRITAPSKKEAENLKNIKDELKKRGYDVPLVADIHFTPNAAEVAARLIEKVRINPGNYIDKKKFDIITYSDVQYAEEIDRIRDRFQPLLKICKEYGTAMRIGTNHGSLSDRIMSRYGDTPMGMVESAMEFLRIARDENYHNIVLSMKSSNPQVMVEAYRMLVSTMKEEFGECYPLHLGVTEAGDGEDGRVKSAVGIGTLLEDGIGDTVRVSLTEEPELEIPVCRDLVKRYNYDNEQNVENYKPYPEYIRLTSQRRDTFPIHNIGGDQVPVVVADLSKLANAITPSDLESVGYTYDRITDKWKISDTAADYIYTGYQFIGFHLPGTLSVIVDYEAFEEVQAPENHYPLFTLVKYINNAQLRSSVMNFVTIECSTNRDNNYLIDAIQMLGRDETVVLGLKSGLKNAMQEVRQMFWYLEQHNIKNPAILFNESNWTTSDENLIHYATECGALLLNGYGDGICCSMTADTYAQFNNENINTEGRNYNEAETVEHFLNTTAFSILQATRTRISKTEYISCPSCGRTLFDLQETTSKIRAVTHHLKGLKIAIMGCIVNGPGEMADADFGYVGSGVGKITLYKGKEVVRRNIDNDVAVEELINILKENNAWVDPA